MARTVLCFGDSNTHGTLPMEHMDDRRRLGRQERWPGVVAGQLGSSFHVIEEGLPGRTTVHPDPIEGDHKEGHVGLMIALETHRPIDLVVLLLGTNDLKPRFAVTSADIAVSLEKLVSLVRSSDCGPDFAAPDVLLISPPRILETGCLADKFTGGAAKSDALGSLVRRTAERCSCRFLDAATIISSSPVDGIHFDSAEHEQLGNAIAAEVMTWAEQQSR